jgi:hypothetical protein
MANFEESVRGPHSNTKVDHLSTHSTRGSLFIFASLRVLINQRGQSAKTINLMRRLRFERLSLLIGWEPSAFFCMAAVCILG